jgi:hypothetical protein
VIKPIKSIISEGCQLEPLLAYAETLNELHKLFVGICPQNLSGSTRVLGLKSGILTVSAKNPIFAAKLRQIVPTLIPQLRNAGCEVSGIRVKVQVSYEKAPTKSAPRKLGTPARRALKKLSDELEDSPLKASVNKLIQSG